MLSIVFSTFNEANNKFLFQSLDKLCNIDMFEVICVDGGSTDGTALELQNYKLSLLSIPNSTRAARLNLGIKNASHNKILLHHPRSTLADTAIEFLKINQADIKWGAFQHRFDNQHYFLKFISWYSNNVRVLRKHIVYLDHCILVEKQYLIKSLMPDIAIFEDTALSVSLKKQGLTPILIPYTATTSAIRFLKRGIYKQFLMNQFLKFLYSINFNHLAMNKLYEKQLNLNQNNKSK